MTIIEFLRSLSWEFNMYEVSIIWSWLNKCPVHGKYYELEDDEYSCEGYHVADYIGNSVEHLIGYPDVYNTEIAECEIKFERMQITIRHTEFGSESICEKCEKREEYLKSTEGPVNLFVAPMTWEEQIELSDALDGYTQWFDNCFDKDDPNNNFHTDLTNLYMLIGKLEDRS